MLKLRYLERALVGEDLTLLSETVNILFYNLLLLLTSREHLLELVNLCLEYGLKLVIREGLALDSLVWVLEELNQCAGCTLGGGTDCLLVLLVDDVGQSLTK